MKFTMIHSYIRNELQNGMVTKATGAFKAASMKVRQTCMLPIILTVAERLKHQSSPVNIAGDIMLLVTLAK